MAYHLENVEETAKYVFKWWKESPLIQRWLGLEAQAAEQRLASGIAELRSVSMLAGAADLALTAGVPLAVWVGVFVALGAPYAEARALVRNESYQSGFSQGFVTGLLDWEWGQAVSRFFHFGPGQINPYDETLSYIAANAYNEGLHSGYVHARSLSEDDKKVLLHALRSLSPQTSAGQWDRLDQISYVIDLASAGRRYGVFRTG